MLRVLLVGLVSLGLMSTATASKKDDEIAARLAPVGSVCVEGKDCGSVDSSAVSEGSAEVAGNAVYDSACAACHNSGAAGAPKLADIAAWQPRIAKGIETLYSNAINGINAMPAKGFCPTCTDKEIQTVVDYMVESAK